MSNTPAVATDMQTENPAFAAWVPSYSASFSSMDEWLDMFRGIVAQAAEAKTALLLVPEYVSESWMSFCPAERLKPTSDAWQAEQAQNHFFPEVKKLAAQHQMVIAAGTVILKDADGTLRNRAMVFFPDGTEGYQDKVSMMPDEREVAGLMHGDKIKLFHWNGYSFAIIICLDIQIPRISAQLTALAPDFLLVPTMTTHETGFNRVSICAAARSVELHCPVLLTGGVGTVTARGEDETNTSGAALYLPHDISLSASYRRSGIGPLTSIDEKDGLLYLAGNVPVGLCRTQRQQQTCEAWHLPNHQLDVEVLP